MFGSNSKRTLVPGRQDNGTHPVQNLHQRVNRLFDDFWQDFLPNHSILSGRHDFVPRIDISENEKEMTVHADLPGMKEDDVDVTLSNGVLTISGEKKSEHEEKSEDETYHVVERSYGSFRRDITVGADIDEGAIKASFENGVLVCHLPKKPGEKPKVKKIKVNKSKA